MEPGEMDNARIALDIVERSPSVALRVSGENGAWNIRFITSNVSFLGYAREEFLSGAVHWEDIVHPDDLDELCRQLDEYAERGVDSYTTTYRLCTRDGQSLWVSDSSTVTRGGDGEVLYADCIISDHNQVMENQEKIQDSLRQQRVLNDILQALHTSGLDEAFQIILDRTGEYLDISRVILFEDSTRHTRSRAVYEWDNIGISSMMEQGDFVIDYKKDIPEVDAELRANGMHVVDYGQVPPLSTDEFASEGVIAAAIFAVYRSGGERYGFICFDECVKERKWDAHHLVFLQNIAKLITTALVRKANEESIRKMAYQDQLTGLNNRYSFDMYMERATAEATSAGKAGYVLFIDMDDFKVINDGYGHDYGDALLIAVAEFMQQNYGEVARLFRFGGDEFTVLVDHRSASHVQSIIDGLLARARHPWSVMDKEFYCTISLGVVRYPEGTGTVTEVIKNADIALYQAKNSGKNHHVVYNQSMDNFSQKRAETEHRMREAIEDNFAGFMVYYQPLVDIDGDLIGAEALVRWKDKDGKLLPPGEFIPLAEYLGLIIPLGEFVLRQAAAMCRRINRDFPRFFISVNVSIRQFQQSEFLQRAEDILRKSGVNMANIVLEVTEGMVVQDLDHMELMAEQLRGMGLRIAMDDFGTGYSSLNNMRRLPLDIIKIDRSFIRDVTRDDYAKSFIRLITDLGHSMGRAVCVEGVETAAQYGYCADCGVDYIQGFYFHRPMPADELDLLLLESRTKLQSC